MQEKVFLAMTQTVDVVAQQYGDGSQGGHLHITDRRCIPVVNTPIGNPLLQLDTPQPRPAVFVPGSEHVVSFEGFPPLVNEAFVLAVLRYLKLISDEDIKHVTDVSDNDLFPSVQRTVYDTLLP